MKKTLSIVMLVVLCLTMVTTLCACGGSSANDELVKWVNANGKTWADAQAKFDADYAQAIANDDESAMIAALNTVIEATSNAKSSLEKIDRSKLSDANKESYDQNLNNITESLNNYETTLSQL